MGPQDGNDWVPKGNGTKVIASSEVRKDIEKNAFLEDHLTNHDIASFAWQKVDLETWNRKGHSPAKILDNVNGSVSAGELLAIMGPSGSGKTSLLNFLAGRSGGFRRGVSRGTVSVNGIATFSEQIHTISSFVEQEDTLIGALTVRETLDIAARLSLPSSISRAECTRRTDELLQAFGLQNQANVIVSTPIRKGISGGQKRRLSVANQLITAPKVLFLDEPTSGLESTASFEVMRHLRATARRHRLIIIASMHQPSSSTFHHFDKLLLLSEGKTCYCGDLGHLTSYMEAPFLYILILPSLSSR